MCGEDHPLDHRFVDGAMVLVMILATHRVDAAWSDHGAGLFDRRDDVVAAGGESRVGEILLDHLGHPESAQRAMRFLAAIDAGVAAAAAAAEYQCMDA